MNGMRTMVVENGLSYLIELELTDGDSCELGRSTYEIFMG
jgi:hypothetical protein